LFALRYKAITHLAAPPYKHTRCHKKMHKSSGICGI
jgi:hypothetical protein